MKLTLLAVVSLLIFSACSVTPAVRTTAPPRPVTPASSVPTYSSPPPLSATPTTGGDATATHEIVFQASTDEATIDSVVYYVLALDNTNSQNLTNLASPWSATERTDSDTATPSIGVRASGTANAASCRITVDGVVKVEKSSTGPYAYALCSVLR